MAVGEQVFGFFIPTVTLMGVGAHKEIGKQVKALGGKKPLSVLTRASPRPVSRRRSWTW